MAKASKPLGTKKKPRSVDVHVGRRVRMRRTEMGISQTVLAEQIGVTFQQVQKYEKGTNRIGSSRLVEIAKALGCQPAYFYNGLSKDTSDGDIESDVMSDMLANRAGLRIATAFLAMPREVHTILADLLDNIAAVLAVKK